MGDTPFLAGGFWGVRDGTERHHCCPVGPVSPTAGAKTARGGLGESLEPPRRGHPMNPRTPQTALFLSRKPRAGPWGSAAHAATGRPAAKGAAGGAGREGRVLSL